MLQLRGGLGGLIVNYLNLITAQIIAQTNCLITFPQLCSRTLTSRAARPHVLRSTPSIESEARFN